jgi:hypothetical protein
MYIMNFEYEGELEMCEFIVLAGMDKHAHTHMLPLSLSLHEGMNLTCGLHLSIK